MTAKQAGLEARNSGAAYLYRFDGTDWVEVSRFFASDATQGDAFGWACSTSGDWVIISTPLKDDAGINSGIAYLFNGLQASGRLPPVE